MDIFESKTVRVNMLTSLTSIVLILGVFFCIYTPNYMFFKWWSQYASQITIAYWILGLLFLAFKSPRLTLIAFISCAFLCLYLKNTTNPALAPPKVTSEPIMKIAQFNLTATNSNYDETIDAIKKAGADIISIQEVSPDWNKVLKDSLSTSYPYNCQIAGLDIYSMKLYSKYAFATCDTLYCDNVPNLILGFNTQYSSRKIYIIASYIAPPIFSSAYQKLQHQLDTLATHIKRLNCPVITVGDYNIHGSAFEIQQFRHLANLKDSRRGYRPDRSNGYISLLEVPTDHIFYTAEMTCIEFITISGPHEERLGIEGSYQFNKDSMIEYKPLQLQSFQPCENCPKR